jgi:hypothetical protein
MAPYTISHCTVADSAALTRNNISAFWEDPHYALSYRHRTLEQHISEVSKETPRNLLDNRTSKRHQKAIDPETGRLLGYSRWNIPLPHATDADGTPEWPEAVVSAVGPEEEAEIGRIADTAVLHSNNEPDEWFVQVRETRKEILERKTYMRTSHRDFAFNTWI